MLIKNPQLPPKAGYVEVEVDGERTYQNIATGILIDDEVPQPTTEERLAELEAQNKALTTSNQFLEDCLVEMAAMVYA